jgi:hypothetical protein
MVIALAIVGGLVALVIVVVLVMAASAQLDVRRVRRQNDLTPAEGQFYARAFTAIGAQLVQQGMPRQEAKATARRRALAETLEMRTKQLRKTAQRARVRVRKPPPTMPTAHRAIGSDHK